MLAVDLLTALLVAGVVVLVVSTSIMIAGYLPASKARPRKRQQRSKLSPSAAKAMAVAEARAAMARAQLSAPRPSPTVPAPAALAPLGHSSSVSGQIIDISDRLSSDQGISAEDAEVIAAHYADTDPQRVAEVINQWIRADSRRDPDEPL